MAKPGNSSTQERIALLGQFLEVVGGDKIDCLVADRSLLAPTGSPGSKPTIFLVYPNPV